jgi:hypothetical protein
VATSCLPRRRLRPPRQRNEGPGGKSQAAGTTPGFSIADYKALKISDVPAYLQQTETHLFAGLRKAGIKEN